MLRAVLFEGCVADPVKTITTILPETKGSVLLLRIVMQGAMGDVLKVHSVEFETPRRRHQNSRVEKAQGGLGFMTELDEVFKKHWFF